VLSVIFLYYREFVGSTMTENLGLALGTVGLAILWRGAVRQQLYLCLLGILSLTLALNARSGAFFILPALLLWGAWSFRHSSRISWRFLIGGAGVVLLGFILNSLVFKAVSSPHAGANSNFSYTLYGLIVGGDWRTVFAKHPEIESLSDIEKGKKIYALVLEAIRANPLSLVSGSMRAWKQFLFDNFIFSFATSIAINIILQGLSLVALVNCYRQRHSPIASVTIASTIGILLSVPFVPPWDAGTRTYAATIPFFSLLPSLGLTFIAQKTKWHQLIRVPSQKEQPRVLLIFGLSLVLLTVGGPISTRIATKVWTHPRQFTDLSCPVDREVVYFRHSAGSSINLVADDAIWRTYVPNIRISDFQTGLYKYYKDYFPAFPELPKPIKELSVLSPNTTLINKFNFKNRTNTWVIADSSSIPKERGIVAACGKTSNTGTFHAESMTLLSR
jgi:hypothetical protein